VFFIFLLIVAFVPAQAYAFGSGTFFGTIKDDDDNNSTTSVAIQLLVIRTSASLKVEPSTSNLADVLYKLIGLPFIDADLTVNAVGVPDRAAKISMRAMGKLSPSNT
jgi:hypothetical protein